MASTTQTLTNPAERDSLALLFQEIITVIARIRADRREIPDLEVFRTQASHALRRAEHEAIRRNYTQQHARLGAMAVAAFLDETMLMSPKQALHEWAKEPLGPNYFGQHVAGNVFFDNLQNLLRADEAPEVADVLEVYQLCMLLGYRGRFFGTGEERLPGITTRVAEKIARIRQSPALLAPNWAGERETRPAERDRWGRLLLWGAAAATGLALAAYVVYSVLLHGRVAALLS